MSLIMNLVGASGYNADGSVQVGAAGWKAVAEAVEIARNARAASGGEAAPATAGGPASDNGLSKTQSVQATERKNETESGRPTSVIAGDGASRPERETDSRKADGARDLFYERLVESFTAAPGARDEETADGTKKKAETGPATDGEVVAGLSLARFGFKLFGAATS